jgi:hypothetical protein
VVVYDEQQRLLVPVVVEKIVFVIDLVFDVQLVLVVPIRDVVVVLVDDDKHQMVVVKV